jgi:hypothetical protein
MPEGEGRGDELNCFSIEQGVPWFSMAILDDLEKLCGSECLADK